MTKLLKKYYEIMDKYRAGDYGTDNLTMSEILIKANEPDLLERMNISEINFLCSNTSGLTKKLFSCHKVKKQEYRAKMLALESELKTYGIEQFSEGDSLSDSAIARNLQLNVQYTEPAEMPPDVEATLSVSLDPAFVGVIKILKNVKKTKFPYMHEIIHYFRDVGVGNKVDCEYTRKIKGKTETEEEQDINYLTAAAVMPADAIAEDLNEFERMGSDQEDTFLCRMVEKYGQDKSAVLRRFSEVHILSDIFVEA